MQAFKKLLNHQAGEWHQSQREALVDLLLLGMYADQTLSLKENDFIEAQLETLPWTSGIALSGYVQRSIAHIRALKDETDGIATLLADINKRLANATAKQHAIEALEGLFASDQILPSETTFLNQVKNALV